MNNSIKVLSTRLVIYTCTASMYRVKDRTEYTYSLELSSLSINTYFTKEEQVTIQSEYLRWLNASRWMTVNLYYLNNT